VAEAKQARKHTDGGEEVLEKIAAMRAPYAATGKRLHALILESAPELKPRVWYGMPGYAKGAGPVLCFFRVDEKYMTFGLTEKAKHVRDEGAKDQLMASAWFFNDLNEATEKRIAAIVQRAVS
jgi:hypothetical protein